MSEFSMNIVTRDGAALIAQATATNPIVIESGVSREDAATDASDLADKTAAWYTGKGGRVAAVSAAGGVARIVIAWGHEGVAQPAKSLAVLARLESQSVSQSVVLCAMSDPGSTVVLPGADDTAQAVEVPFNIAIDPTADIQVTPGAAASLSDLDRFVSCHKAGNTESGESQVIFGEKTFQNESSFDGGLSCNSVATFNKNFEAYSGMYVEGAAQFVDGATISSLIVQQDATVTGSILSGNIEPVQGDTKDIGANANRWRYIYCQYCIPEYLGLTSNRVPNAFISNLYGTNITIAGTLSAGTSSNAKNILIGASMSGGSLQVTRLDNAAADLPVYNAIGGTSVSEGVANIPVGSLVLAYIELSAGAHILNPGSILNVTQGMRCKIALPSVSGTGAAPYRDTGIKIPVGYYRLVQGAWTDDAFAGGETDYPAMLQRIAESDAE